MTIITSKLFNDKKLMFQAPINREKSNQFAFKIFTQKLYYVDHSIT